ncbi:hypothetical protein [Limnoglobus roseus]|uniref:WD40 repeat domain-containing protein n=1 Tax=Limnoglobus roseus TaxID=2598579 RepID=A0A5C1AEV5_9BACT|nr:hypothetical protein [Limnoglobus roseus]QEL17310.1 WD40 repeat domain-containing protein [Limnoglobus roseus]
MTFTPWFAALVVSALQPNGLPQHAVARLGASPTRLGQVQIAVSADSKRIVTVTPDGQCRIFDAATGQLLAGRRLIEKADRNMYGGNTGSVAGLSADGSVALLFDGEDYSARSMRLIETDTGKTRLKYPSQQGGNTWLASATLSSDAKKILVNEYGVGNPRNVIVDVATGTSKSFVEQPNGGVFIASGLMQFSPDGTKILLLDTNNIGAGTPVSGTCYNAEDGKKLWTETVGMYPVFTADSKSVLGIGVPKMTGLRDATTGKEVKANLPKAADAVGLQVPGPNDLVLFPMLAGESVVWSLKTGKQVAQLPTGRRGSHSAVAFAKDGSFVITAYNGHLCRWDLPKGEKVFGDPSPPGPTTGVSRLVFSPDGQKVFCLGEGDVPGVWNLTDKSWAGTPQLDKPKPRTDAEHINIFFGGTMVTQSVAYPASGPRFLTGGFNAGMDVRDGLTGKTLVTLKEGKDKGGQPSADYHYGQLSADGATATIFKMNYTGNQSKMTFETWDVGSKGKVNFTEFTIPNYASMPVISPCGRFAMLGGKVVVIASGNSMFSIVKGQQPQYYYYGGSSTFANDGRLMATSQNEAMMRGESSSPGTIHVWDVVTGKELRKLVTGSNSNVIAFSPDDRLIAFAGAKGVRVFDLFNGVQVASFPVTDMHIPNYYEGLAAGSPLAFTPDGRTLATGHLDGTVTLWAVPKLADVPDLKDDQFDKFWDGLAEEPKTDPRADVYRLMSHPDAAMKLLNAKFVAPPHKPIDVDLAAVIRSLGAPAFPDRLTATRKLRELGPRIAPALHEAIRTTESVEVRARAEELLEQMKAGPRTYTAGPDLRASRAIEVLERIGSPDAKKLLQGWANHTTNVRVANDAALALVRIAAAGK